MAPLLALLLLQASGPPRVELRADEVWLMPGTGSSVIQLTRDGRHKSDVQISPNTTRVAYIDQCYQGDKECRLGIVVMDLTGRRLRFLPPGIPGENAQCGNLGRLEWIDDHHIGAQCHINPSLEQCLEIDTEAAAHTTRTFLGLRFTPSPDRKKVAHLGWIPHFSPPYAQSHYIQINGKTVYPPEGRETPQQKRDLNAGVHGIGEFQWSPDSSRLALVDQVCDWKVTGPDQYDGDFVDCRYFVVVAGENTATLTVAIPKLTDSARINWDGNDGVALTTKESRTAFRLRADALVPQD
jgi:hypothetical protein